MLYVYTLQLVEAGSHGQSNKQASRFTDMQAESMPLSKSENPSC